MLGEDLYHCNYCNITRHEGRFADIKLLENSCFPRLSVSCPIFYCRWHYHSCVRLRGFNVADCWPTVCDENHGVSLKTALRFHGSEYTLNV
ncbi:hypothetical protein T07_5279 [Trichinella nelsoni]|uniref:Uncharacterized protein n=1 Tax=Trichinella nelsoni TaxID=6336 RepID=A0A0V0S0Q6_9BILA|nr:hypothetical protein T07_5279 [Trichinella nelsoni]